MTTPIGFNPGHHPILDLSPHEFVRKANEAGIKLAVGAGSFRRDDNCGCAAGAAAQLIDPHFAVTSLTVGTGIEEFEGIVDGFDDTSLYAPNRREHRTAGRYEIAKRSYTVGHAWGSAVRAAALEIQGDLEPTPLKGKQVKS